MISVKIDRPAAGGVIVGRCIQFLAAITAQEIVRNIHQIDRQRIGCGANALGGRDIDLPGNDWRSLSAGLQRTRGIDRGGAAGIINAAEQDHVPGGSDRYRARFTTGEGNINSPRSRHGVRVSEFLALNFLPVFHIHVTAVPGPVAVMIGADRASITGNHEF